MKILSINGDTSLYGLIPLEGWEDAVLSPITRKKLTYNDNAGMDGTRVILQQRKVEKRTVSIQFYLSKVTGDKYDYYEKLNLIEENLVKGMNNTGINHIAVEMGRKKVTYYMLYESSDKYQCFGGNRALITIKFVELNPKTRDVNSL